MTTGQLSRAGAGVGAAHEACYLFAYPDPGTGGDPWTIAVGHTAAAGPPIVRRGDRVTIQRAFEIYAADMASVENRVRRGIRRQLKPYEFDAACIFDLNTGAITSGSIDEKLNAGDVEGAMKTWSQYINAGGKPMNGLRTRRAEEIALFRTGRYPVRKILIKDTPTGSGRYIDAGAIPWRDQAPEPLAGVPLVIEAERPPVVVVKSPVKTTPVASTWFQKVGKWFADPRFNGV